MKKVVLVVSSKRLKAGCRTCEATKEFWKRLKERHEFDYQEIDIDTKAGRIFAEKHSIRSAPTTVINGKVAFLGIPNKSDATAIIEEK